MGGQKSVSEYRGVTIYLSNGGTVQRGTRTQSIKHWSAVVKTSDGTATVRGKTEEEVQQKIDQALDSE